MMEMSSQRSLKQRVMNAGLWSIAGYALSLVIRLGSNLLMTRLLAPEMFGLVALASTVMVGLAMFSDLGLKPNIVQSARGNEPIYLNTAWVTQIVRGAVLGFLAVNLSLVVYVAGRAGLASTGSAYDDPNLPYVIAALSLTAIISGFDSTKLLEASRNLHLAKITRNEVSAQVAGLVVMIVWVGVDRSVWALVAGNIASSVFRTLLSHIWLPGTSNRWQWDRRVFKELIAFGKWIFLSSILFFFASNGDQILLGGLVSASSLGAYAIAFLIFSSIDQALTKIIVDVSFPALSEVVRERAAKLSEMYYRFHFVIASFSYFCCGFFLFSGRAIVELLYDRRYQQAGWILEILAVALMTIPFRVATQCLLALGRAETYFYLHSIRIITLFVALPLGFYFWGFRGAIFGVVVSYFSSLPWIIRYAAPFGMFHPRKEVLPLLMLPVGMIAGEGLDALIGLILRNYLGSH